MREESKRRKLHKVDWDLLSTLAGRVVRAFYDSKTVAVLDALVLCRRMGAKDEHLKNYLKLPFKDVVKACQKLREERFVKQEHRTELTRVDGRRVTRSYYIVDWRNLIDVTKWKLWRIRKQLEQQMQKAKANMGYRCPLCRATFTPLDAQSLLDMSTGLFKCRICGTEVEENNGTVTEDGVQTNEDILSRFMEQTRSILDILKLTDDMELPEPVTDALNLPETDKSQLSGKVTARLILAPAAVVNKSDDGKNASTELHVVFGNSEEELQQQPERTAHRKTGNSLPIWHQVSTVTGERVLPSTSSTAVTKAVAASSELKVLPLNGDDLEALKAWYRLSTTEAISESASPALGSSVAENSAPGAGGGDEDLQSKDLKQPSVGVPPNDADSEEDLGEFVEVAIPV